MTFLSLIIWLGWFICVSVLIYMGQSHIRGIFALEVEDGWSKERKKTFKELRKKWFKPLYFPWPVYDIADLMCCDGLINLQSFRNAKIMSLIYSHNEFLKILEDHSIDIKTIFKDKPFTFENLKKGTLVRYISPVFWQHEVFDQFIISSVKPYGPNEYFVPKDEYHWIIECPPNFIDNGLPNSTTLYSLYERTSPYYSDHVDARRREMKLGTIGLYLGPILVKWRGIYENLENLDEECGIVLFNDKYYIVSQECIQLVQ